MMGDWPEQYKVAGLGNEGRRLLMSVVPLETGKARTGPAPGHPDRNAALPTLDFSPARSSLDA